ncbi:NAD(+) synthase [Aliifodinibius sp. S!AR15-10]|uniref:NAD(+) synthase n=1 Tax=Aliifodinibius sp. S!AR15-10 TaxID=2950437 RepID=UPI00285D365D|nr:NAD(+) synthase [Aliifodinibius sp. S!AR15-10]MDR8394008.1 NAD(+) synthase [Aliifodinibius sp. S!AR15-10]
MQGSFKSIYSHGFLRAAVAVPPIVLSDPKANVRSSIQLAQEASAKGAAICVFPELGLTGYTNDDLFHQATLLNSVRDNLTVFLQNTRNLHSIFILGAPLKVENALYNCAVVIYSGDILGVVPKSYLPNYREFYEKRQFTSGLSAPVTEFELCHRQVPFGNKLLFEDASMDQFKLHVEICEDLWVPAPPSTFAAMAGATILANLSASNVTIAKPDYRRLLCTSQSAKTISAYLYSAAGSGESTTDMAWDGHGIICENGDLLTETKRFQQEEQLIFSDIDLDRISQERMRMTSFNDNVEVFQDRIRSFRKIYFNFVLPAEEYEPVRSFFRFPYVPAAPSKRNDRCEETYNIQVQGLYQRMKSTGIEKAVIGVSGGLDSTHALLVAVQAAELLKLPRTNILAYTMPGFATSQHTLENARNLMTALGVESNEIDIKPSSRQMLSDIGHPHSDENPEYDVTFENVQAGDRTSHLFRLANFRDALVIGTGDLSELALGWTTYGVGDHMSHYNVNVSVPKTLIQYLVRWVADNQTFGEEASGILYQILDTEISPELIPSEKNDEYPSQSTEEVIGPYELQDFNLYYLSRFGYLPSKVAFMAYHAWKNRDAGDWPDPYAEEKKNQYSLSEIKKWLEVFLRRFFAESQFKRSALPNGPKVGSGGSLSPRSDWRAPSDSNANIWLDELQRKVP